MIGPRQPTMTVKPTELEIGSVKEGGPAVTATNSQGKAVLDFWLPAGRSVYAVSGVPAASLGKPGDSCLDTSTGDVYVKS